MNRDVKTHGYHLSSKRNKGGPRFDPFAIPEFVGIVTVYWYLMTFNWNGYLSNIFNRLLIT